MVAGIVLAGKVRVPGFPRFAVEDVHRFLGLLAGMFVAVHVTGLALDRTVPFDVSQLVVPFTASYRPLWTGLGVVALELLVALALTNRFRRRMPYRAWRALHYLAFVIWGAATLHGVMSGTDRDQPWARALYAVAVALVLASLAARLAARGAPARRAAATGVAAAVGAAAAVGLSTVTLTPAPVRTSIMTPMTTFTAPLRATISTDGSPWQRLVSVTGQAETSSPTSFRIDLLTDGRSVADTALQLEFATSVCSGQLTALDETGFAGSCSLPDGTTRTVSGTWSIDESRVSGEMTSVAPEAAAHQSSPTTHL